VKRERAGDRRSARRALGEAEERSAVGVLGQGGTSLGQPLLDAPEQGDRRRPRLPVPGPALGAQVGTEGEELGELGHDAHVPLRRDPHEPVRVEVVTEEDARVAVRRGEKPRLPVMQEVALVDRLDADREPFVCERREDRQLFPLGLRTKCGGPERALVRSLERDGLPDVYSR
jgi:hypothetical protein